MSHSDVTTVPEQAAVPRKSRRIRLTGACAALAAGAVLVSGFSHTPAPKAQAHTVTLDAASIETVQNQTPLFWWNGSRWDYFGFLNSIRRAIHADNNNVPGSSNTVDHTDTNNHGFFDVVIGDRNGHQVRLRLRRDNLYLMGWFDSNDTYNYIGNSWQAGIPNDHRQAARAGARGGNRQLLAGASYDRIERLARTERGRLHFNQDAVSSGAGVLWHADYGHPEFLAQSLLFFTQFVAEAARFRGIADTIGWQGFADSTADNWRYRTTIDPHLIDQETSWDNLSQRFNWMLLNNVPQDSARNALNGALRTASGAILVYRLITMSDYARVLNMALGYPKRG